jgi:hypothetical protein
MRELIKNKKLILQHIPGKGSWTYHIIVPNTKDIKGKWGYMKVSGKIDGYEIRNKNLAPVTNSDKILSVNSTIRKAINKTGGDEVNVTLYLELDNRINKTEVIECFEAAGVLENFKSLSIEEQDNITSKILLQADENAQEKAIKAQIGKLYGMQRKN